MFEPQDPQHVNAAQFTYNSKTDDVSWILKDNGKGELELVKSQDLNKSLDGSGKN